MHNIILYSTNGCPLCRNLEKILNTKKIPHTVCKDEAELSRLGITHVPMLSINGEILRTPQAMKWALGAKAQE